MAKGGFPGFGGGQNMQQMLKQAQKMQQDMAQAQEELAEMVVEASSGGGAVTVKVSGAKELLSINIKPEAVDADDVEMLEDLIKAAVNEGLRMAEEQASARMSKATGGMNLGGLF